MNFLSSFSAKEFHCDLVHLVWYRLRSVAGAMFYSRFLVPQTVSAQANEKVIHCCCCYVLKMKHKFVGYCKTGPDN